MSKPIVRSIVQAGLITCPINVMAAQRAKDLRFRRVHRGCGKFINNKMWCEDHGEVQSGDLVQGYELAKGKVVTFEKGELPTPEAEDGHPIKIEKFVDLSDVDPVHYETTYWVTPQDAGKQAFVLLRDAMREKNVGAFGTFTFRTKTHPVILRPHGNIMAMEILLRGEEVVPTDEFDGDIEGVGVDPRHLKAAGELVEAMTEPLDLDGLRDEFREQVIAMAEAKFQGKTPTPIAAPAKPSSAPDLMEALRKSLETAKAKPKAEAKKPVKAGKR